MSKLGYDWAKVNPVDPMPLMNTQATMLKQVQRGLAAVSGARGGPVVKHCQACTRRYTC